MYILSTDADGPCTWMDYSVLWEGATEIKGHLLAGTSPNHTHRLHSFIPAVTTAKKLHKYTDAHAQIHTHPRAAHTFLRAPQKPPVGARVPTPGSSGCHCVFVSFYGNVYVYVWILYRQTSSFTVGLPFCSPCNVGHAVFLAYCLSHWVKVQILPVTY